MKIPYIQKRFSPSHRLVINQANKIIEEYQAINLVLTLRQLYYQFVSRDWLPNKLESYNLLKNVMTDARLAGQVDWLAIEDRTRNLKAASHWNKPADIVQACSKQYRIDRWAEQPLRIEVWIEKEALAGVLESPCYDLDVPFFACKGYTSTSEMWAASQRLLDYVEFQGQNVVIIHLGDHDPSGIDMTRDIEDRLKIFLNWRMDHVKVDRIALNMDQVTQYNPPPNPAKTTDVRFKDYQALYGDESWELDALNPSTLVNLVRSKIEAYWDSKAMKAAIASEEKDRTSLAAISNQFEQALKAATKPPKPTRKRPRKAPTKPTGSPKQPKGTKPAQPKQSPAKRSPRNHKPKEN